MANKRKKVDKYSRLKPRVSPLTIAGIGVFVLIIILTIFLVTDSASTKFLKAYQSGARQNGFEISLTSDHNFEKVKFSKVEKLIENNDEIIIYFGSPQCVNCLKFVEQAQRAYDNDGQYNNDVANFINKIYYVELKQTETGFNLEGLEEFYEKYEIDGANAIPAVLAFKNGELVVQYEVVETEENLTEENILFRSVDQFFKKTSEQFGN